MPKKKPKRQPQYIIKAFCRESEPPILLQEFITQEQCSAAATVLVVNPKIKRITMTKALRRREGDPFIWVWNWAHKTWVVWKTWSKDYTEQMAFA